MGKFRPWKPTKKQLETIADMGTARMPIAAMAKALGVHSDTLGAWIGRLVATRDVPAPPVTVASPSLRIVAD
jgi:hypothetical protein